MKNKLLVGYTSSIRQLAHVFHTAYQSSSRHGDLYERRSGSESEYQSEAAREWGNPLPLLQEQVTETVKESVAIGEEYGGGIVFYVDGTGKHGLVVAKADMPAYSSDKEEGGFTWSDARLACDNFVSNGCQDWFLPNKEQLNQLYLNKGAVGGFADNHGYYWSSSEYNADIAWLQNFSNGTHYVISKTYGLDRVRAVRAF